MGYSDISFIGGSSYRGAGAQMVSETTSPASKSKILPLVRHEQNATNDQ